ncbi:MAG: motility protein A [Planctomycetota bacterium]
MTKKIDIATVVGYIGAFASIVIALLTFEGGKEYYTIFFEIPAFMVAFVGSFFAVIAQFSLEEIKRIPKILINGFVQNVYDAPTIIREIVKNAEIARKEGILALEKVLEQTKDPFMRKGIQLAIDGTPPDTLEKLLTLELENEQARHETGYRLFEQCATLAPAFGMMGTIIGLGLALIQMKEPEKVGPAIAASLLSTLYGVFACYAIYTPIAKKLEKRSEIESFAKHLIIRGIVSIQSGDNPRIIEEKLKAFLATKERNFSVK